VRKLASLGVGLAVVISSMVLTAPSASARSRRHHRKHHHTTPPTPSTPVCGPGTVLVTTLNQCVTFPFPPGFLNPGTGGSGFAGGAGITISPNSVFMTPGAVAGQGSFSGTFTMSGLPPLTTFNITAGDGACPITVTGSPVATTSTSNTVTFGLANAAGNCQQGGHPVNAISATSIFTAFVTFTR
jgi:hypothetical protein